MPGHAVCEYYATLQVNVFTNSQAYRYNMHATPKTKTPKAPETSRARAVFVVGDAVEPLAVEVPVPVPVLVVEPPVLVVEAVPVVVVLEPLATADEV